MSKEADEIANRIFEACSPKSRFHRDMVTAMHKAEIETGDGYEIISSSIADQLIKLGYVKVVRCGECRWWEQDEDGSGEYGRCLPSEGEMMDDVYYSRNQYCSEGEPKEAGE